MAYYVSIMTNHSRTLYTGMTRDLQQRVYQHKTHAVEGFTSRYCIDQLVYYEEYSRGMDAIAREKEIKGWRRSKKAALIEGGDPHWEDLARDWYGDV
jgi:putative endonuclease